MYTFSYKKDTEMKEFFVNQFPVVHDDLFFDLGNFSFSRRGNLAVSMMAETNWLLESMIPASNFVTGTHGTGEEFNPSVHWQSCQRQ